MKGSKSNVRTIVTTILVAVMAFSGGVAVSPYLLSLRAGPEAVTVTHIEIAQTSIIVSPTSSSFSSATSVIQTTSQSQTQATSQRPKWISSGTNVVPYLQASSYVGQTRTVEGKIVYTYNSGSAIFLDFHYPYQGYFYVVIFPSDAKNFNFAITSFYMNKEVRVTGLIQLYKGSPEIIVRSPSQIEVAYMGFNYP